VGNGVSITAATPSSPVGPIIVGLGGTATANGGYLVKSTITTGTSGGCEQPTPPPLPNSFERPIQFTAFDVQFRPMEMPLIPEILRTFKTCNPHPICCNPDFNNDGDVGTDLDIQDFFACLGGDCCPTCGTADFNCDGDIGTDADIESFFRVLSGGPC
jgi:hypothetical protein